MYEYVDIEYAMMRQWSTVCSSEIWKYSEGEG